MYTRIIMYLYYVYILYIIYMYKDMHNIYSMYIYRQKSIGMALPPSNSGK